MWILTLFLLLTGLLGIYAGKRTWFTLDRLTRSNVLNGSLIVLVAFTLLMLANTLGFFPQSVAAPFMMFLYTSLAGFFAGYAFRQYSNRASSGSTLYQNRSFWIDYAPNFLAMFLILYGLYRTALLTEQFVTGIRITSGLSLICFGLFIFTLKPVPEFRSKGIILLDRLIPWKDIIAWKWESESVLKIEFLTSTSDADEQIQQFVTSIPQPERKEIETILKSKMDEFEEERKKRLLKKEDSTSAPR